MRQMANVGGRPTSRLRARSPAVPAAIQATRQSAAVTCGSQNQAALMPRAGIPPGDSAMPYQPMGGKRFSAGGSTSAEGRSSRNSRLAVVVRKRPMNRREAQSGQQDVVACKTNTVFVREPKLKVDLTRYVEEHNFFFDHAFDETVTNEQLYCACVMPVIEAVFNRAKCTCFAYGQTGSGKTFTMIGPPKSQRENGDATPGIFLLAAQDIFRILQKKEYSHLGVFLAFYEIYCGKLFDLLNDRKLLHARENAKSNVVIVGLQEHPVENVQELMEIIEYGLGSRTTGVTGANADSSRSHAVLQICLKDLSGSGRPLEYGKLSFIDLAGSERGADTNDTDKQTRIDGAEINKSLLALKECIRAMDHQHEHTPFRGSKLTQVLKDSFTGSNCRTVMIANVSPCSGSVEHSLNTLRYAYRVKELRRAGSGGLGSVDLSSLTDETTFPNFAGELPVDEESSDENSVGNETPPVQQLQIRDFSSTRQAMPSPPLLQRVFTGRSEPDPEMSIPSDEDGSQMISSSTQPTSNHSSHKTKSVHASTTVSTRDSQERSSSNISAMDSQEIAPEVAHEPVSSSSRATLDELARRHDRIIGMILTEEEELINMHREHVDFMVELLKEEMIHLDGVDRPGSDVDAYVASLEGILAKKADHIAKIQRHVNVFKAHLSEEDSLSRQFQSLASSSG